MLWQLLTWEDTEVFSFRISSHLFGVQLQVQQKFLFVESETILVKICAVCVTFSLLIRVDRWDQCVSYSLVYTNRDVPRETFFLYIHSKYTIIQATSWKYNKDFPQTPSSAVWSCILMNFLQISPQLIETQTFWKMFGKCFLKQLKVLSSGGSDGWNAVCSPSACLGAPAGRSVVSTGRWHSQRRVCSRPERATAAGSAASRETPEEEHRGQRAKVIGAACLLICLI